MNGYIIITTLNGKKEAISKKYITSFKDYEVTVSRGIGYSYDCKETFEEIKSLIEST